MKKESQDITDIIETLDLIQSLETLEEKEEVLKEIKYGIRKLEIIVVVFGLVGLLLIILPFFGVLGFSLLTTLAVASCVFFIFKAFRDGEQYETVKFFLLMSINNQKNKEEDGE